MMLLYTEQFAIHPRFISNITTVPRLRRSAVSVSSALHIYLITDLGNLLLRSFPLQRSACKELQLHNA
jgi:hypothetical protein